MAKFEGTVEAFRYTPTTALAENSIVKVGALVGITRSSCEANTPIMAFMAGKSSIYSLPLATGLSSAVTRGTIATVDSSGNVKPAEAGDAIYGVFWEAAATTDSECIIMLAPYSLANGEPLATSTTPGIVRPDNATLAMSSTEPGVIRTAGL